MYSEIKAWPFEEARKLVKHIQTKNNTKGFALFETGYGPSGLPHIGTFAEVLRTTMVRHAFSQLSDIPTKLFSVSDDMDALRKVPLNVPNQEMLAKHLGKPLTKIPDPFGEYESFGAHNNARLKKFLDSFNFEYTFKSSTECYKSGIFDDYLKKILIHYDQIMAIMLPTLREERQQTYSPFLPICPQTGIVLQVKIEEIKLDANTVVYKDLLTQKFVEIPVTGGHCKLQWKVDWPMRWSAFDVDYEMYGKDLIDSVTVGKKICKVLNTKPPEGIFVELFLDEQGQKISKSKGTGLTMEEWLKYGTEESLAYYIFQNPKRAKRLYFDIIPKATDEYMDMLSRYIEQESHKKPENPVWHIHQGEPPSELSTITFSLLLNLASVCSADSKEILWRFVKRYKPGANPKEMPFLDKLIERALNYYKSFSKKTYRAPTDQERQALVDLYEQLKNFSSTPEPQEIQTLIYETGKKYNFENLRNWFKALYEILLGQSQGPRMGSFIALYGINETCALIKEKLGTS